MLTSSPASFSNYGIFIPKIRVPSSSHKKIVNIVELCPTVDSPLERTSEGNPRVQDVDQVQNPTKNPFTYLMSTVAFFKLQMIYFVVYLFIFLINSFSSVAFIFFATYLVLVTSQESSFDKYVCYFSAILVKYMQWNEMKWREPCDEWSKTQDKWSSPAQSYIVLPIEKMNQINT